MTLLHKNRHIPLIRAHEKTVTRRDWKSNYAGPRIGSVQMVASADMVPDHYDHNSPMLLKEEDCTCFVQVMDKYHQPLGEMTDKDARREGDYESVAEFKVGWERIHGDGSWDPEHVVTVIEYEYVGENPPDAGTRIAGCPNCLPDTFDSARETMEAVLLGDRDPHEWLCDYHRYQMNQDLRDEIPTS